jgi:hypothetical protein
MQDKKGEFVDFMVEDQVVGYIHKGSVFFLGGVSTLKTIIAVVLTTPSM